MKSTLLEMNNVGIVVENLASYAGIALSFTSPQHKLYTPMPAVLTGIEVVIW